MWLRAGSVDAQRKRVCQPRLNFRIAVLTSGIFIILYYYFYVKSQRGTLRREVHVGRLAGSVHGDRDS